MGEVKRASGKLILQLDAGLLRERAPVAHVLDQHVADNTVISVTEAASAQPCAALRPFRMTNRESPAGRLPRANDASFRLIWASLGGRQPATSVA